MDKRPPIFSTRRELENLRANTKSLVGIHQPSKDHNNAEGWPFQQHPQRQRQRQRYIWSLLTDRPPIHAFPFGAQSPVGSATSILQRWGDRQARAIIVPVTIVITVVANIVVPTWSRYEQEGATKPISFAKTTPPAAAAAQQTTLGVVGSQ